MKISNIDLLRMEIDGGSFEQVGDFEGLVVKSGRK